MLKLVEIDFLKFKEEFYSHYIELFPEEERQPIKSLKKLYEEGILKFIQILDNDIPIGFLMYVTTMDNPYVWLSYFAIFKEYQNKNYGTKSINLLKKYLKNYDGIYGEIEKVGVGKSEQENFIRMKRANFWSNLGFEIINVDLYLYDVLYSPCVCKLNDHKRKNEEIVNYGMKLYKSVLGEELFNKVCYLLDK